MMLQKALAIVIKWIIEVDLLTDKSCAQIDG